MELTKEQLKRIEHYLNVKKVLYIDFRMEIFDHIVSNIEAKMTKENPVFETVFYSVTDKWNKQLEDTSSFYFGIMYSLPKIVIEKAKKHFKKWFFLLFLAYLIPAIFLKNLNVVFSDKIENGINLTLQLITVVCFIILIYCFFKKDTKKQKTTYSFIMKTQIWNLLIGCIIVFNLNFISKEGVLNSFNISLLSAFVLSTYSYFHFYKKHKEVIKFHKN